MKKRNKLLFLGVLLASATLAACSSSTSIKGKGIAQLMHDDKERVFYLVDDDNDDALAGKDEDIIYIYVTKKGKLKRYYIDDQLKMDDVVGKNTNEVKKLAEEKSKETFEIESVNARVVTDSSGNNTTSEQILLSDNNYGDITYRDFVSLSYGQIRDKYYSGYVASTSSIVHAGPILVTEVPKDNAINFDKVDGKIVTERK